MGDLHVGCRGVEGGGHRDRELWHGWGPAPPATISQLKACSWRGGWSWSWLWSWALRLQSDVGLNEILEVPDDLLDVVDVVGGLVGGEVLDHVVQAQLCVAAVREGTHQATFGETGQGGYERGEISEGATVTQQAGQHHHYQLVLNPHCSVLSPLQYKLS